MWNWTNYNDELYHHGIKGQKWGIRRFQNSDGSLTPEGEKRYGTAQNLYKERANEKKSKANKALKRAAISYGAKIALGVAGGLIGGAAVATGKKWASSALVAGVLAESAATWSGRIQLAKSAINYGESIDYNSKATKLKEKE